MVKTRATILSSPQNTILYCRVNGGGRFVTDSSRPH
jgi:hypothetical protein